MGVVAPLTGVVAATIPVLVGFALGERPGASAVVGIAVALLAVLLISRSPDDQRERRTAVGVPEALIAAAGFGGYFVLLSRTNDASGLWPLVWSRGASIVMLVPLAAIWRPSFRIRGSLLAATLGSGLLDVSANLLYLQSVRAGLLTLSSVLTSLYPASTVLLARIVLNERLDRVQRIGLAFAAAGIVLIALGGA
jgi:drug/metabolite transporter (DMT)-like permease